MLKAIKVKIYPDDNQKNLLNQLLGSCRFVYNYCLNSKIDTYKNNNLNLSITNLNKIVINLKNTNEYFWLKDSHSKVIQQTLLNLDTAYKNFFKHKKGFPKFKSKKDGDSCRFPVDAIMGIIGNRLNLTKKLNNILFKSSPKNEKYLNKYKDYIKSATLTKTKSGEYFISILIDNLNMKELPHTNNIVGIDLGIKDFVITSDSEIFENIKLHRNNEKKLIRLQKELSKKELLPSGEYKYNEKYGKDIEIKTPSKNREKARIKLAKYNKKIKNKKNNYLHYVANQLLNENQVIVIEDLNIKGMMQNHKLAKAIQEVSIGEFIRILEYKANWYGREVIKINRFYPSSKLCSNCEYKNTKLTLKDREWECPNCGMNHDRDINAAINIREEGIRIYKESIGLSKPEYKPVENTAMDDPTIYGMLKSKCLMKQEIETVRLDNDSNEFH